MKPTRVWAVIGLLAFASLVAGCAGDGAMVGQAAVCGPAEFALDAERPAGGGQTAKSTKAEEGQAGKSTRYDEQAWEERLELIEVAAETMAAWFMELETMTLEATSAFKGQHGCTQLALDVAIRLEPLAAWSVGDFSPWFELMTGLPLPKSEPPVRMQQYLTADGVNSTVTGLSGWGGRYWYWPLDFDDGVIHQYFGIRPSRLTTFDGGREELECVAYGGGAIVEDEYEGEAVWVVTCEADVQSLVPLSWEPPDEHDEWKTMAQVTISQSSGAPLVAELHRETRDDDGALRQSAVRIVLQDWNEPIDFPKPEPIAEDVEYAELLERFRASAAAPQRLLELAESWRPNPDDAAWASSVWLERSGVTTEGDPWLEESRCPDVFERTISIAEPSGDGFVWEPRTRLVWDRDGFRVSESEVDGERVWTASAPVEHGFGDATLNETLAAFDWFNLDLFQELIGLSEPESHIPEDGGRDYYVSVYIEALEPGDEHFDRIAALVEMVLAGMSRDDLAVSHIDGFGISIQLDANHRQLASLQAGWTFRTDSGAFNLSLERIEDQRFADIFSPCS